MYAGAFDGCSKLTSIDLSHTNLSEIDDACFTNCSALTSVSFPSSLQTIGNEVFLNCPNLSSITWDAWDGKATLGATSFDGIYQNQGTVVVTNPINPEHSSIKLLNTLIDSASMPIDWGLALPSTIYDIDSTNNVLYGFSEDFLQNISDYADFRIMKIPASVTMISSFAFYGNSTCKIPSYIKKLTFEEQSEITEIGSASFRGTTASPSPIKSVDLINCSSLEAISASGFEGCQWLSSIYLPSSLSSLWDAIFQNCRSLKLIVWDRISKNPTKINSDSFKNVNTNGIVKITHSVQGYTSTDLLNFLKTNGGLPTGWTAEE